MISSVGNLHLVAHQFDPNSLKIAREYRGFKKNSLAKKLDLTPGAISQFESGQSKPNATTLARLGMALGFPVSFFSRDIEPFSPDLCHFRSLRSCSPLDRRRMLGAGSILAYVVDFIDQQVHLPEELVTPVTSFGAETEDDIEEAAAKVRTDWGLGLGPIENVVGLLESKGIFIFRLLDECKRLDAFSVWHNQRPFVFLNSEKDSPSRNRFDAAHELGHLVLHPDYVPGDSNQEAQAHRFAGAFLLPYESFINECPRKLRWDQFLELKVRWKVSLAALVRRARDLKLISADTYRRAMVQIGKRGWRTGEPNEPEVEWPSILPGAIRLVTQESRSLADFAQQLSLKETDLVKLVYSELSEPSLFT